MPSFPPAILEEGRGERGGREGGEAGGVGEGGGGGGEQGDREEGRKKNKTKVNSGNKNATRETEKGHGESKENGRGVIGQKRKLGEYPLTWTR